MSPLVSVIVPCLYTTKNLPQCLESLLQQTEHQLEVLCITSTSSPDIFEMIRSLPNNDNRIKILRTDNCSYGSAVNIGILAAKGIYISIIPPEDYIAPEMYETLCSFITQNTTPDIIMSAYYSLLEYESGFECLPVFQLSEGTAPIISLQSQRHLLTGIPAIWACLLNRAFLTNNSLSFPVNYDQYSANLFLYYHILYSAKQICWVNRPFCWHRELSNNHFSTPDYCRNSISCLKDLKSLLDYNSPSDTALQYSLFQLILSHEAKFITNAFYTTDDQAALQELKTSFSRSVLTKNKAAWFARKSRGFVKCLGENGVSYTIKHLWKTLTQSSAAASIIPALPSLPSKTGLRVMFIASDNNSSSGAFLCMIALINILREKYHVECLVILPCEGTGTPLLTQRGIPCCLIPSADWVIPLSAKRESARQQEFSNKKMLNEGAVQSLMSIIRKYKFDLIHINTTYSYVGAAAALRTETPFIWHLQEFLEEDQRNTLWDRKTGNLLINRANRIIAISDAIYRKYKDIYDNSRLVRIYDGIDTDVFYQPEKKLFLSDIPTLIMIGALIPSKGQVEFAKACVRLYQSGFQQFHIQFLGVGEDETIREVHRILDAGGILSQAEFLGYVSNVQDYLRESDISFTCSVSEAFGRTTVEAMLSGNLVIGANSAGTCELIRDGETGYLYRQGDPEDLCSVILKALNTPKESQKIADAGRQYMVQNMSAEANADQIYSLYQDVLS